MWKYRIYPVEQANIKKNIQILTKDEKPLTCEMNYGYSVNPKTITGFYKESGNDYVKMFVLPRIYAVMRSSFRELDSANIKILELEKEIKYKLNNDIKFPEFLKTELYKKKIIDNIGSLLNYRSSQNIASNPSKDFGEFDRMNQR